MFRSRSYWNLFQIHTLVVCASFALAWSISFHSTFPQWDLVLVAAPILVLVRWMAISSYKLAHGHWLYTGIGDLKALVWAVLVGSVLFVTGLRIAGQASTMPVSFYFVEGALTFLLSVCLGVNARLILLASDAKRSHTKTPVLIVGAGSAAVQLLRALRGTSYRAVGMVDDDRLKQRLRFAGVPVVGKIDQLPALALRYEPAEVLIAIPSATGAEMTRITDACTRAALPFRAVPSLSDLVDGRVTISEFRKVNLDDLLGREPVQMVSETVRAKLKGRVVMVTGAAGSIGSELCKQIVRYQPKKLICVDQAETPLFNLQQHTLASSNVEIVYSVADFTRSDRMRQLLLDHHVMVILHAAAYKHVPMTEMNPDEGLQNNVFGLQDLVDTADECGCEDFLLISTDKAVKPSSLMGCTKRIGEMIVGSRASSSMRCISVRFGNVLGSQGSVIPLFQEQIRTRKCITITHPEMTRYFMTIPEAVSLVLQAFTVGEHGNILVLDMGEPVRIVELAKTLIRISGSKENEVRIVYTGMRPGEKLNEELFYDSEVRLPTAVTKVMRARGFMPEPHVLRRRLHELQLLPPYQNADLIRHKIKQIVPEYEWEPREKIDLATDLASEAIDADIRQYPKLAGYSSVVNRTVLDHLRGSP